MSKDQILLKVEPGKALACNSDRPDLQFALAKEAKHK